MIGLPEMSPDATHIGGWGGAFASVGGALLPTVYVNSVGGNDSNDGLSAATPKQTLAAAVAIAGANARIGLAKGSFWRETLDVSTLTAPTVMTYGTGNAPYITGSDALNNGSWSKTGGRTNVYEQSVTHDGTSTNRLRVYYDDGLGDFGQLVGVADVATCDSTAGSFVRIVGSDGSPATLYIHAPGSVDPTLGAYAFSYTARTNGIYGPDDCTIIGPIHVGECISNNGALDLVGRTGGSVNQVVATFGSKHNMGFGSGVMEDCIALYADAATVAEPSNTAFVAFLNDGSGETAVQKRCGLVGPAPGTDFYSHGTTNPLDSFSLEQCWTLDGQFAASVNVDVGRYVKGTISFPVRQGTSNMLIGRMTSADDGGVSTPAGDGDATITDGVFIVKQRGASNFNEVWRPNAAYASRFVNCAMVCDTDPTTGNYTNWVANGNSNQDIGYSKCVLFNGLSHMRIPSGGAYVGDFNIFMPGGPGVSTSLVHFHHYSAGWCVTLAAWQSATSQDANSVYVLRGDQVRGDSNALWLGVANDENDGPIDGDFRINPGARTYDASNVARVGLFADGVTPITEAGPQNHWDWNARAAASGPPTAFPTTPTNITEALANAANPGGWNYYP